MCTPCTQTIKPQLERLRLLRGVIAVYADLFISAYGAETGISTLDNNLKLRVSSLSVSLSEAYVVHCGGW